MNEKIKIGQCKICGKILKPNQKGFCSCTCWGKYRNIRNKTFFKCKICGKKFMDRPSKKRIFCGRDCFNKYQSIFLIGEKSSLWKGGGIEQICFFCKKKFKNKQRGKFCNRICYSGYRRNLKGKQSPNFNINMKMAICQICRKKLTRQQTIYKCKFCSRKCFSKYLSKIKKGIKKPYQLGELNPNFGNHSLQGKNNPNWKGGISNEPYSIEFNEKLKEKIRKRDNYICQNEECNMTEEEHLIVYGFKNHCEREFS